MCSIIATFLFGFFGLVLTIGSIFGLVASDGDPLTNLWYLGIGLVLLILAVIVSKGAKQPSNPQGLFSAGINPLERATRADSKEQRELAIKEIAEGSNKARQLTSHDHNFIERIKADMINAPSYDEIIPILSKKASNRVVLANPSLQPITFAIKPGTISRYVKGLVLETLFWAGGIIFLPLFLFLGAAFTHKYGILYQALRWRRQARRYRVWPLRALRRDIRDPILYLRSFSADYEDDLERYLPKTAEEKLVGFYGQYGPVITVGQPGEELPLLGASRLYFDKSDWQAGVLYLMSVSQLVIIQAGFAPGLLWELGVAHQRIDAQKLIISFSTWDTLDEWRHRVHYLRFKAYVEELLGFELPTEIKKNDYICFEEGWKSKSKKFK